MSRSKTDSPSSAVTSGLRNAFATVWRWTYEGSPEFVCLATNLGRGRYAVVSDGGIKNPWGHVYGPFSDLYISSGFDGSQPPSDLTPVRSSYETPIPPVSLLTLAGTDHDLLPSPRIATMGAIEQARNATVWRMGFSQGVFPDQDKTINRPARATPGYINRPVARCQFRGAADPLYETRGIVVDCCFGYPGRCDFGSPVCTDDGGLSGILVGNDTSSGHTHIGYYVPIEMLLPFIDLENALSKRNGGVFGVYEPVVQTRD